MTLEIATTEQFFWFWGIFLFVGLMLIVGSVSTLRFFVRLELRARYALTDRKRRAYRMAPAGGFKGPPTHPISPVPGRYGTNAPSESRTPPARASHSAGSSEPLRRQAGPRDWSPRGGDS